ncbi:MAG: ATP synthase F1 subunit delta [Clostridia bacterium]|nr:ATP synthase F1 subunit delta [Clostridia bacterium]
MNSEISREYAEALFALAKEENDTSGVLKSLDLVADVFNKNPEYLTFLNSLSIPANERTDAIKEALSGKISDCVLNFLCLICERNRANIFFECVEYYKDLYRFDKNITVVSVKSSVELSPQQKSKLKSKLEKMLGGSAEITYTVDKSLIGGMVIETNGKIIDGSLKTKLHGIKEVISR